MEILGQEKMSLDEALEHNKPSLGNKLVVKKKPVKSMIKVAPAKAIVKSSPGGPKTKLSTHARGATFVKNNLSMMKAKVEKSAGKVTTPK